MKATILKIQNELSSLFWNFFFFILLLIIFGFMIQKTDYIGYLFLIIIIIASAIKFSSLEEKIKKKIYS